MRGLFVGLATLDVIQQVAAVPAPNQKVVAQATWLAAGGPATVAAITFAALGGQARLWTALGTGPAADAVRADLVSAGVEVIDAAPDGYQLAASTVLVTAGSGERAVVSGSAQRPVLGATPTPPDGEADVILADGHLAELALAVDSVAPLVVDAGSHKPGFSALLARADYVLCSADYVHPDGLAGAALAPSARLVACSAGAAPVRWWAGGISGQVPVPEVAALDTLSAGDVWHGAFCHAIASGRAPIEALAFAVGVAAERVGHLGPFAWRTALPQP